MTPKDSVNISDFDYPLPDERIARFPADERDASRLLVYRRGALSETRFRGIGGELPEGAVLVFNNTKVIRARIVMHKPSGARVEVFCLEPHAPADYERAFAAQGECRWQCIVGNLKKWKEGPLAIDFDCNGVPCRVQAWREGTAGTSQVVRFTWDAALSFGQLLEHLGRIPIPPYLGRDSEEIDNTRYQTVYSKTPGSAAAPTAGLHFTKELLEALKDKGVKLAFVTLHVGLGTFRPVKEDEITDHVMHSEFYVMDEETAKIINDTRDAGGDIWAVGTTATRTLETIADETGHVRAQSGWTAIFIYPGYRFKAVDHLITNFHLPESTLMMLISAFATREMVMNAYQEAIKEEYRFFSFGDSMLLY